jgi:hypothetical protein
MSLDKKSEGWRSWKSTVPLRSPSARNMKVRAYWDSEGAILLDVMQRGITINSDTYNSTVTKM